MILLRKCISFEYSVVFCTECTGSYNATGNDPNWSVQWTVREDMIDFNVSALTTGWVGIGFSENDLMVSTLFVDTFLLQLQTHIGICICSVCMHTVHI